MDEDELVRRAMAAYFRHADDQPIQPNRQESGVEELGGKHYVVLRSGSVLAVYRVTNQGQLRRMKRPPKEITA